MRRNSWKTWVVAIVIAVMSTTVVNSIIPGSTVLAAAVTGQVAGNSVNVRDAAEQAGNKLGTLDKGDEVTILGEENGWYKIEYDEGIGFVSADYVEVNQPAEEEIAADDEVESDGEELAAADEELEEEEEEISKSPLDILTGNSTVLIVVVVVVLLIIIILSTIISIRKLDDDDDFDDYDDYDDYEDDYDEEEEYYEPAPKKKSQPQYNQPMPRPRPQTRPQQIEQAQTRREEIPAMVKPDPTMFMSDNPDDYKIDIDPKYFEPTAMLPNIEDADAPTPIKTAADKDQKRSEELAEAVKKMEELKQEIERIKSES